MIWRKLAYGNEFCSLEITSKEAYAFLKLEKKKGELSIVEAREFRELTELGSTKINQLFVNFNSDKVLSKLLSGVPTSSNEQQLFQKAFPNISVGDFYKEISPYGNQFLVSIIRKQEVDEILNQIKELGVVVSGFSVGNGNMIESLDFFALPKLASSNVSIEKLEGGLISADFRLIEERTFELQDLSISNKQLLNFATALQFYANALQAGDDATQKHLEATFFQKRVFELGIRVALSVLLVGLLINFLFFSHYSSESQKNINQLSLNDSYKRQLGTLQELSEKKKVLVDNIQSVSDSRVSWILNSVFETVPASVFLSEFQYQPQNKRFKKEEPLSFAFQKIVVKGTATNDVAFTQWLQSLEDTDFIEEVTALDYGMGSRVKNSFSFHITLKDGV